MEIHVPHGPVDSIKEILMHIFIVTVGILIALGLEGIRESWREHVVANEARDDIRAEMSRNLLKIEEDMEFRKKADAQLEQILKEMPELAKTPTALQQRMDQLNFRRYGMALEISAWDEAIASGAIPHMRKEQAHSFANYDEDMKYYLDLTRSSFPAENDCRAYIASHDSYTRAEAIAAEEKLIELALWENRFEANGPGIVQHMQKMLGGSYSTP
jgi:hypothetical protein